LLWYVWYVHDQPFDSRIVNPALRYHSLLGPTFMINCQLFDCGLFCLEITTGRASLQQRCSKLKLSFFTNIENLDIYFDIWLRLWPSSFLPRLTASVIFFKHDFTKWRKIRKNLLYIFTPCQFYANQPPFQALVLCFERSKRKRAFPKALRLTQSGVRGLNLFWNCKWNLFYILW